MSINWVMLHETQGFVRLPGETSVYGSSHRTALTLTTPRAYPGNEPFNVNSSSGTLYLTNQRIVYLPEKPTQEFKSFAAPLLNLHDTHITIPWFGPNAWQAVVQPVPGGNIPSGHSVIELKITFKEGGAPDFHSKFEVIKERLHQALEASRSEGRPGQRSGPFAGVNMDSVHLDQLPSYEASGQDRIARPEQRSENPRRTPNTVPANANNADSLSVADNTPGNNRSHRSEIPPPADAPPGYEEAQQQSVQEEFDRRLSQ